MDQHDRDPDPSTPGVDPGHHDGFGRWCTPSSVALGLIRDAMGLEPGQVPRPGSVVAVSAPDGTMVSPGTPVSPGASDGPDDLGPGQPVTVAPGSTLRLEDGSTEEVSGPLPRELPTGYHEILDHQGGSRPLLVSPGRCHLPADLRTWGITAQLYAARSRRSWGIGDLADLGIVGSWGRRRGAGLLGINPLHAPTPTPTPPNSPYSPSSRRWRDPLMISVEDVSGFADLPDAEALVNRGRQLSEQPLIDRSAAWGLKRTVLEDLWRRFRDRGGDPAFDRHLVEGGDGLRRWGVFCTVADRQARSGGPTNWRDWPTDLRRPDAPGVARVAKAEREQVEFWGWLQWLVDRQLADADVSDVLLTDLAVGFAADGFDAWEWQDLVAAGVRIGAPPDPLGRDGQDWGLPPFVPWRLSVAGYRPLAETLRSAFAHSRGVRIDHVMGLFRLFWLPPGLSAAEGAYVRFAGHDLLHVVAIESERAGGMVVGEDLGTVEDGVRETLAAAGVLSTRLLWFEDRPTSAWPRQAMAAITTHDLPTVAGVWTGADLDDLDRAGVTLPPDGHETLRHHLRVAASCDDEADVDHVIVEAHRTVADSPAVVATAALDDLVGATQRPNVPGTIDEHPNWRIPLPVAVDDLEGHPLAEAVAEAMRSTR